MSRVHVTHPDTGETLFLGPASEFPMAGFVIERREPMPNGGEVVVRSHAPRAFVTDDFAPPAPIESAPDAE